MILSGACLLTEWFKTVQTVGAFMGMYVLEAAMA